MKNQKKIKEAPTIEKKHRHKWVQDYCDCPFCVADHAHCSDCGDMKNLLTNKINDF